MIFLLLISFALGDLPVHCTYKQIVGDWTFTLNLDTFHAYLDDIQTYCGHGQPDHILDIDISDTFDFSNKQNVDVSLQEPNIAYSSVYGQGTWTMIYDEGFLIDFQDKSFFTYSLYVHSQNNIGNYDSVCDKTTIGWYRGSDPKDHRNWGCFFATKNGEDDLQVKEVETDSYMWIQPTDTVSFLQTDKLYDDYDSEVNKINQAQLSWTAELNPQFKGMTMMQVNQQMGRSSRTIKIEPSFTSDKMWDEGVYEDEEDSEKLGNDDILYYWNTPNSKISEEELPESWDWTNISGVNYVPSPREQKSCGSCYILSTIEMIESRLRILTNNDFQTSLSIQYALSCNFYTEGCNGGYPTLVNKFISEFNLIPESCAKYQAKNTECITECENPIRVSLSDYYYIGGYYGASDEENMMKEIRARGPIIANLEPSRDFSFYKNGVYESVANRKEDGDISSTNMRESAMEWEKVDHSILIVGWGIENGTKYWKAMNSWGTLWGENGFFRIKRGVDECAIESMGEAAIPYIV